MATYPTGQVDNIDQSALTLVKWPGTLGSSDVQPIVIDQQIRGGLRFCAGGSVEQLTEIRPQRLEDGMIVYLKTGYTSGGTTRTAGTYYKYSILSGQSRSTTTGELPNAEANWSIFGAGGGNIPIGAVTTGSSYTLVLSDAGKCIQTLGIPIGIPASTFSAGDVISIFNNSSGTNIAITPSVSVTLRLAGSSLSGARSLTPYGLATILFISSSLAVISGQGVV